MRPCGAFRNAVRHAARLFPVLAFAAVSPAVSAYVLIDDFTVGEYHAVIEWPDTRDSAILFGLDRNHSAFGVRSTDLAVNTNFDKVPVSLDIGGGKSRVSYDSPSGDIATDFTMQFGRPGFPNINLSAETEIWIDLFTEDPPGRLADQWSITIVDHTGWVDTNPGWLHRNGGIRFRMQDFDPRLDWSRINNLAFRQIYSPNSGDVPMAYTVTKVYTVPEPSAAAAAAALALLWRLRASSRSRR